MKRASGILMPIFSLPSDYGIGTFGYEAFKFIDFLCESNQAYWQILPLGPTSYGDSPYQSFSSFSGNPYFIDFDILREEGLLKKEDYEDLDFGSDKEYIDYGLIYKNRLIVLKKAYRRFDTSKKDFLDFIKDNNFWLADYALYMTIKKDQGNKSWLDWEDGFRNREEKTLNSFLKDKDKQKELYFFYFIQYEFFKQWNKVKKYANDRGIKIIGDLPIYIAMDSADAWANTDILLMKENKDPKLVAGVPPDAYSEDGQLWGNPIYDWEKLKSQGYRFWIDRIRANHQIYDVIRLDHFIGFVNYYAINYEDENAKKGTWYEGPRRDFFDKLLDELPYVDLILEDLGVVNEEVKDLQMDLAYPGMKVIQFGFSQENSTYLPHNYIRNSVCYSSTHDSNTIIGWIDKLTRLEREKVFEYFNLSETEGLNWGIIKGLMSSVANLCVFQIQDLFAYGEETRINRPGIGTGNWRWRLNKDYYDESVAKKLAKLTNLYGRKR